MTMSARLWIETVDRLAGDARERRRVELLGPGMKRGRKRRLEEVPVGNELLRISSEPARQVRIR